MRRLSRGFSLVELMVAVALAMVTGLVVLQVLSNYQGRKQTTSGRNDAEINAALGMYSLEREVRMAGAGLMTPSGMLCNVGVNIAYNGVTISDAAPLRPIRIVDGGAGPDQIDILRSTSNFGAAPSSVLQLMASATTPVTVDGTIGLTSGDLMLVGAFDGNKVCTLMQMSAAPVINGTSWNLPHASGGGFPYNPADPSVAYTTAVAYDVRDLVMNLGRQGWRRFAVVCNNGGVPTATNNCDLASYDLLAAPNPVTLAAAQSETPQVIELQAQYGVANAGSQTVNAWVDATGGTWAVPTEADQRRIKAIRVAIVARGNLEGGAVTPGPLVLWDAGLPSQRVRALSAAEQRYRYQVLTVVIPLINTIWATL
jgi:type IV pilus assembly protein PilW